MSHWNCLGKATWLINPSFWSDKKSEQKPRSAFHTHSCVQLWTNTRVTVPIIHFFLSYSRGHRFDFFSAASPNVPAVKSCVDWITPTPTPTTATAPEKETKWQITNFVLVWLAGFLALPFLFSSLLSFSPENFWPSNLREGGAEQPGLSCKMKMNEEWMDHGWIECMHAWITEGINDFSSFFMHESFPDWFYMYFLDGTCFYIREAHRC